MKLRVLVISVLAVLAMAVPAFAGAPPPAPTYAPASGPPGTIVNVSNITLCDGQQPPVITGQIGFGTDQASIHTPTSFTPPDAQITIPDVANGDYRIFLFCGSAVESVAFTVSGSTAQPVTAPPTLTG